MDPVFSGAWGDLDVEPDAAFVATVLRSDLPAAALGRHLRLHYLQARDELARLESLLAHINKQPAPTRLAAVAAPTSHSDLRTFISSAETSLSVLGALLVTLGTGRARFLRSLSVRDLLEVPWLEDPCRRKRALSNEEPLNAYYFYLPEDAKLVHGTHLSLQTPLELQAELHARGCPLLLSAIVDAVFSEAEALRDTAHALNTTRRTLALLRQLLRDPLLEPGPRLELEVKQAMLRESKLCLVDVLSILRQGSTACDLGAAYAVRAPLARDDPALCAAATHELFVHGPRPAEDGAEPSASCLAPDLRAPPSQAFQARLLAALHAVLHAPLPPELRLEAAQGMAGDALEARLQLLRPLARARGWPLELDHLAQCGEREALRRLTYAAGQLGAQIGRVRALLQNGKRLRSALAKAAAASADARGAHAAPKEPALPLSTPERRLASSFLAQLDSRCADVTRLRALLLADSALAQEANAAAERVGAGGQLAWDRWHETSRDSSPPSEATLRAVFVRALLLTARLQTLAQLHPGVVLDPLRLFSGAAPPPALLVAAALQDSRLDWSLHEAPWAHIVDGTLPLGYVLLNLTHLRACTCSRLLSLEELLKQFGGDKVHILSTYEKQQLASLKTSVAQSLALIQDLLNCLPDIVNLAGSQASSKSQLHSSSSAAALAEAKPSIKATSKARKVGLGLTIASAEPGLSSPKPKKDAATADKHVLPDACKEFGTDMFTAGFSTSFWVPRAIRRALLEALCDQFLVSIAEVTPEMSDAESFAAPPPAAASRAGHAPPQSLSAASSASDPPDAKQAAGSPSGDLKEGYLTDPAGAASVPNVGSLNFGVLLGLIFDPMRSEADVVRALAHRFKLTLLTIALSEEKGAARAEQASPPDLSPSLSAAVAWKDREVLGTLLATLVCRHTQRLEELQEADLAKLADWCDLEHNAAPSARPSAARLSLRTLRTLARLPLPSSSLHKIHVRLAQHISQLQLVPPLADSARIHTLALWHEARRRNGLSALDAKQEQAARARRDLEDQVHCQTRAV